MARPLDPDHVFDALLHLYWSRPQDWTYSEEIAESLRTAYGMLEATPRRVGQVLRRMRDVVTSRPADDHTVRLVWKPLASKLEARLMTGP